MSQQAFQSSLDEITLDKRCSPWTFLGTKTMIIGNRGCGKNSLAMSIVDKIYDLIDDLYYFSSRIDEYEGVEPYSANDFKLLPKIVETIKLNQRFSKEANEEYHACIVLNDVIYERNMQKEVDSLLQDDNSNITIIVMTQYPIGIHPNSRESFKHVFVCRENYISNQKRIYDHYFGLMGNFATFKSELSALTGYSTLVKVRNCSDLKDRVFRLNPEFIENERALKLLSNISKIDCSELFDRIDLTELEICKDPNVLLLENSRDKRRRFIKSWCDVEEDKYSKIYYLFDSDDEFLKKDISYSDKLERIGSIVDIRNILKPRKIKLQSCRESEESEIECPSIMIVINTDLTKGHLENSELMSLMFCSRHYLISLLFASPEDVSLKPEVRCSFDHIILAHDLENRKRMYDYYGYRFPSFDAFNKAFDDLCSTEHLCIDNRGTGTVLEHVKILSECENGFGTIEYMLKKNRPKLFSIPNPPKCIYRPDLKTNDALKEARMNTINSMLDDIEVDRIMKDIFGQRIIKQTDVADDISWLADNSDQSDDSDDSDASLDSFDRYLKKSDIEDNSDEIRKQKMQEIQYLTSMISYANSRINTIMQELQ